MMVCIKAQEWIQLHIDRSLDYSNEALLMAHLKECDVCSKEYEVLMSIHQVLQSTDEVDLPSDFHETLMKKIEKRPKKRRSIYFIKQLNIAAVVVFVLVFGLIGINNLNQNKSIHNDEAIEEMFSTSAVSEDTSEVGVAMDVTEFGDASLSRASNENERSQKATSDNLLQEVNNQVDSSLYGARNDKGWIIVMVGGVLMIGLLIGYIKLKF
ncbi:anti-sigma factor family protein [Petrocella sp. FN5]|uniref:anti-sigma factor family protein n=1 Tax=Petrocella sp. FN5 TaxID=3032002 RepID=UPI0023DC56BC|nr:zf-HC2 domain-containing protein [Petrocella sp. FN5]MDF1618281.1 zf-HC2 domain-containing protein [Petrocella sp. FN5]